MRINPVEHATLKAELAAKILSGMEPDSVVTRHRQGALEEKVELALRYAESIMLRCGLD